MEGMCFCIDFFDTFWVFFLILECQLLVKPIFDSVAGKVHRTQQNYIEIGQRGLIDLRLYKKNTVYNLKLNPKAEIKFMCDSSQSAPPCLAYFLSSG